MTSLAARLGVAGIDEQAVDPLLEPVRVPEPGEIPPRVEECALRGVLGEVRVPQDPAGSRMEAVAHAPDQLVERRLVAAHRLLDESPLHRSPVVDPIRGSVRGV